MLQGTPAACCLSATTASCGAPTLRVAVIGRGYASRCPAVPHGWALVWVTPSGLAYALRCLPVAYPTTHRKRSNDDVQL